MRTSVSQKELRLLMPSSGAITAAHISLFRICWQTPTPIAFRTVSLALWTQVPRVVSKLLSSNPVHSLLKYLTFLLCGSDVTELHYKDTLKIYQDSSMTSTGFPGKLKGSAQCHRGYELLENLTNFTNV